MISVLNKRLYSCLNIVSPFSFYLTQLKRNAKRSTSSTIAQKRYQQMTMTPTFYTNSLHYCSFSDCVKKSLLKDFVLQEERYIYVRSHERSTLTNSFSGEQRHIAIANTNTRPLLKRVARERYFLRQNPSLRDVSLQDNVKQGRSLSSFKEKAGDKLALQPHVSLEKPQTLSTKRGRNVTHFGFSKNVYYKRISLPTRMISESNSSSRLSGKTSSSVCHGALKQDQHGFSQAEKVYLRREQSRKERALLVRESTSQAFGGQKYIRGPSQNVVSVFCKKRLQNIKNKPASKDVVSTQGVGKIFTKTLMRNGAKLRYQTILRKTLLLL